MNFWDYLRKQATKALVSNIVDEYHKLGELHRQHGRKTNEEETKAIDLNDSNTQWALSCEAVGSDYWEE